MFKLSNILSRRQLGLFTLMDRMFQLNEHRESKRVRFTQIERLEERLNPTGQPFDYYFEGGKPFGAHLTISSTHGGIEVVANQISSDGKVYAHVSAPPDPDTNVAGQLTWQAGNFLLPAGFKLSKSYNPVLNLDGVVYDSVAFVSIPDPKIAPPKVAPCDANSFGETFPQSADGNQGIQSTSDYYSEAGVGYYDGSVSYSEQDLSSDAFGSPYRHTMTYTNDDSATYGQFYGQRWVDSLIPMIRQSGDTMYVTGGSGSTTMALKAYPGQNNTWTPTLTSASSLSAGSPGELVLTDEKGNQFGFGDTSSLYTASWYQGSDPRGLLTPDGSIHLASYWSSGSGVVLDINVTDGSTHKFTIYLVDWDNQNRVQQVRLLNAAGTAIDSRTVSNFSNGVYLSWNITGHMKIEVTGTANKTVVASGLFVDASTGTSGTFAGQDNTTSGNWIGNFGSQGFSIATLTTSLPTYASLSVNNLVDYTQSGRPRWMIDANGVRTDYLGYNTFGAPTEIRRSRGSIVESWRYTYGTGTTSNNVVSTSLYRSSDGGTNFTAVKAATYDYYPISSTVSQIGMLRSVQIHNGDTTGPVINTSYYRYYKAYDTHGSHSGGDIKFIISGLSFDLMSAAYGVNLANADTLTDDQIAIYANRKYEYDADGKATRAVIQAAGCSSCGSSPGQGTYEYLYSRNPRYPTHDINVYLQSYASTYWETKTVETLPDLNQNRVYSNFLGQPMLKSRKEVSTGREWNTFTAFDINGRVTLQADPLAVTGFVEALSETRDDLLYKENGDYLGISQNSGGVTYYVYGTVTSATETVPGEVNGYLRAVYLSHGEADPNPLVQSSRRYVAHTAGAKTIYLPTESTSYSSVPTVNTPVFSDAFSGTPGANWLFLGDNQFTSVWSRNAAGITQISGNNTGKSLALITGQTYSNDQEITSLVTPYSFGGSGRSGVAVRGDSTSGAAYNLIFFGTNTLALTSSNGTVNQIPFTWSVGTAYWFKLRVVGTTLSGKVWANGSAEPGTWTLTQSGWTDRASGMPGLVGSSINETLLSSFTQVTATSLASGWSVVDPLSSTGPLQWIFRNGLWQQSGGLLSQVGDGYWYYNKALLVSPTPLPSDQEVLASIRIDIWGSNGAAHRAGVSVRTDPVSGKGYTLRFTEYSQVGIYDEVTDTWVSPLITTNWQLATWYKVKIRCIGNTVQAKVWSASSEEPAGWMLQADNLTSRVDGVPALMGGAGANGTIVAFDDVSVYSVNLPPGQTTSASYTWAPNSYRFDATNVLMPTVGTAQNGSASPDTASTVFDDQRRPIWNKDADGFIHYFQYDPATGTATKKIVDVDTTRTADFTNLPSGWTTPSGGGKHLITTSTVDQFGRPRKIVNADGTIDVYTYDDINQMTRLYKGWTGTSTTGPVQVTRTDRSGGFATVGFANVRVTFTDTLTMAPATIPTDVNGIPTGGEAISNVLSLVRDYVSPAGQKLWHDEYFNLSGLTYLDVNGKPNFTLGTTGVHYLRTSYGYDSRGRIDRVKTPDGVITRYTYDMNGRVLSTWKGSNDAPTQSPDGFLKPDYTTTGNWIGKYGSQGYLLPNGAGTNIPSYAQVSTTPSTSPWWWATTTTDTRALLTPDGLSRTAPVWYSATSVGFDINFTDGQQHLVSLYMMDYDHQLRSQLLEAINVTTGAVISSRTITNFDDGFWESWNLSGHVLLRITNLMSQSTNNSVVSGIFFDAPLPALWSPTNNGSPANMVKVRDFQYDDGGIGNGNLTLQTDYTGDSSPDRVTRYWYDWRNRQVAIKEGIQAVESNTTNRPLTYLTYDNVDRVVSRKLYDGDNFTPTSSGGILATPPQASLRAEVDSNYDDAGRVYQITSYGVNQTTGALTTTPDVTKYWYNHRGLVATVATPDGVFEKMTYDGARRLTADYMTDGAGGSTWANAQKVNSDKVWSQSEYGYNAYGDVITVTTRRRADAQTGLGILGTASTGVRARVTYSGAYYDAAHRLVANVDVGTNGGTAWVRPGTVPTSSDTVHVTKFDFDTAGMVFRATAPDGVKTESLYDALGRETSTTLAAGTTDAFTTTNTYNSLGQLDYTIEPGSLKTTYGYDTFGRASQMVRGAGTSVAQTSSTKYNFQSDETQLTAPGGAISVKSYDSVGRVSAVVSASGTSIAQTVTYGYDTLNRIVSIVDPLGKSTWTVFDDVARTETTTDRVGKSWTKTFDSAGNLKSTTDPLAKTAQYTYDLLHRITKITDENSKSTSYKYFVTSDRDTVTDANNNKTQTVYDQFDRTGSIIDPLSKTTSFTYDRADRTLSITDRIGQKRSFTYDNLGRELTESWYAVGGTTPLQTQTFAFDAAGNLKSASDPDGNYAFTYDAINRLSTVTEPFGLTLTFTYDAAGNRNSVTDNKGGVLTSTHDTLNRLSTRKLDTSNGHVRVDYTYTGQDQIATVNRFSDSAGTTKVGWSTFTYYDDARVKSISHRNNLVPFAVDYSYTYDADGQLTNDSGTSFTYDAAGQLTKDGVTTITYDSVGNRTTTGYTVVAGNRIGTDGVWTYTYDANGQVTKRTKGASAETWTYGYDHRGQMIWAEDRSTDGGTLIARVEYSFDVFGNRIRRVQKNSSGTITSDERYAYDGWDTAKPDGQGTSSFDVWADLDSTNTITMRRMFGSAEDDPVARLTASGTASWYLTDRMHSVRIVTDNIGNSLASQTFTGYGIASGTAVDRYGYTGREWDSTLQLQYNRDRIYNPVTGRFLSEDPLGQAAGDVNISRYTFNSPTNGRDPSGRVLPWAVGGAVGMAVGGTIYLITTPRAQWNLKDSSRAMAAGGIAGVTFGLTLPYSSYGTAAALGSATWRQYVISSLAPGVLSGWAGYLTDQWLQGKSGDAQGLAFSGIFGAAFAATFSLVPPGIRAGSQFLGKRMCVRPPGNAFGDIPPPVGDMLPPVGDIPPPARLLPRDEAALAEAALQRNALGESLGRSHSAYSGGESGGRVAVGHSQCGPNGPMCAEDAVAAQLGSNANFHRTYGWRPNRNTGNLEWTEIPVCTRCQGKYSPEQFPGGTEFEPNGPWSK